jgi:Holliday junction resolvasome RuvABC DNA-binding subunit
VQGPSLTRLEQRGYAEAAGGALGDGAELGPRALAAGPDHAEDALSALVNLGYKKPLAEEALRKVQQGRSGLAVEELIREALNALMKR